METLLILLFGGLFVLVKLALKPKRHSRKPKQYAGKTLPPMVRKVNRPLANRARSNPQGLSLPKMPASMTIVGKAYVIDGDTIRIKGTKIRIAGIDAPELNMPWGQKSKWAMVNICKGQIITVELDGERSFDRLVGTCFLEDGRDIGAEIVKTGLALDLPEFSRGKYRKFEPEGARRKLCNGKFGHTSIKVTQHTKVTIQIRK